MKEQNISAVESGGKDDGVYKRPLYNTDKGMAEAMRNVDISFFFSGSILADGGAG
jgi:hypothetical protein